MHSNITYYSLYDMLYLINRVYCRVWHTLLEVYGSPTLSEPTNRIDDSIFVSSLQLKNWEREASRRLRIRRLPVILKFAFTIGIKALISAARDGGSVYKTKFVTFSAKISHVSISFKYLR